MKILTRAATIVAVGISLCLTLSLMGQQPRKVDDAALKSAGKTGDEWLSYGLTPGETRYSPLKQINATQCEHGWDWRGPTRFPAAGGGNQEATPLVWNGTIYSVTNWSIVYAAGRTHRLRRSGAGIRKSIRKTVRSKVCCGIVNRGLAIYDGKIIAPVIDGRLEALDAQTGKPLWESRVAYTQDNYTLTMAPRIAEGKGDHRRGGRGVSGTGILSPASTRDRDSQAWKFYTVPGDPSKPSRMRPCARPPQPGMPTRWNSTAAVERVGSHRVRSRREPDLLRYRQRRSVGRGCARRAGQGQFVCRSDAGRRR